MHSRAVALAFEAFTIAAVLAACGSQMTSSISGGSIVTAGPSVSGSSAGLPAVSARPSSDLAGAPSASAAPPIVAAPYPLPPVSVALTKVVSGLPLPIEAVSAGDDRLFVVGQQGRIVIVRNGAVTATFLDISSRISAGGERGLLGLAFHPAYASNGRFFVRYTDPSGDVVIAEFRRSADPDRADPHSERTLLTIPHREFPNHNGGTITFGPDGYLYVGTGDGGGAGDPHGNGQNLGTLLGKLLRIDVDSVGSSPYGIPPDNPFRTRSAARPEIWAYGLRNPYGFSFDRATGDLWIGDVGQNLWEEVDRAPAGGGRGRGLNFGWNVLEATHCFNPSGGCDTAGKTPPLAEYDHSAGSCAIIGGFVYRGSAHPDLGGRYFFADYCSGRIWDVSATGPASQAPQLVLESGLRFTGWGQDANGELYLTSAEGSLYEIG